MALAQALPPTGINPAKVDQHGPTADHSFSSLQARQASYERPVIGGATTHFKTPYREPHGLILPTLVKGSKPTWARSARFLLKGVGRPRTPKPSLAEFDDDDRHWPKSRSHIPEGIIHCLGTLSSQLEPTPELSQSFQAQQGSAQNMIQLLEIKATRTKVDDQHERESLTEMINEWKKGFEGKWVSVQEEWSVEKDHLCRARDEWELKTKTIEDGILARIESHLSVIRQRDSHPFTNGSTKPNGQGLVTLLSPRRTESPSQIATPPANTDSDEDEEPVLISNNGSATSPGHGHIPPGQRTSQGKATTQYPITPESSLVCAKEELPHLDSNVADSDGLSRDLYAARYSAALGVVLLSVAAAAVIWRVKPE
ncbi:hypothetical protein BDM02DRAFT_3244703 [Thelephora ganbajun]|uniref:Uncharacterized protein n=1 Tax=Thelephora ganbajun TaxID=370292 RepID=A0ACB6ZED1_THEGA|nr:hypothetical protein BDM02DRAFT_3244703 [Thelephora ganbajun]